MSTYGSAVILKRDDGTVFIESTDPVVGFTLEVYRELETSGVASFNPADGTFTLAGQARYRPAGMEGRIVLCAFMGWVDGR